MQIRQVHDTRLALGSDTTVVLVCDDTGRAANVLNELWRVIYSFEARFSRFLPASELSQFNQNAGLKQPISPEFQSVLEAAQDMARMSEGLFNPFLLPAVQRAGYVGSAVPGYEHDAVDDHSQRAVTISDKLLIGSDYATIPHGTAIDLGGCGKGFLADKLATILDKHDLAGYWVSLGGDMVVSGYDVDSRPWNITVQSADPAVECAPVSIDTGGSRIGVATSGTFRRQTHESTKLGETKTHHLIDPRTLLPAKTDIRLMTVVDHSALRADVLASCAAIIGSDKAPDYLRAKSVEGWIMQSSSHGSTSGQDIRVQSHGTCVHDQAAPRQEVSIA